MHVFVAILLYLHFSIASTNTEKYETLPRIYDMEDYIPCIKNHDLYCKADITLRNDIYENNTLWTLINESKNDRSSMDRSIIHRAKCVPKMNASNMTSIRTFFELRMNEELSNSNLISYIEDITCTTGDVKITSYDKFLLIFLAIYMALIVYATKYDTWKRKTKCESVDTRSKFLVCFSLLSNWEKLCKVNGNEDFNKLKSIQGIRFYTMIFIILLHTELSYTMVYISNPETAGKLVSNPLTEKLSIINTFLVQIFIFISSWILTFQIYDIYTEKGEFTAREALYLFINRYFRFGVCSTVMILLTRSSLYRLFEGPVTFDINELFQTSCKKNWLQTFLFFNNYLHFTDLCLPPTWYLSVDFQLYIMAIVSVYVILKLKLNEWKVLSFLFCFSSTLYGLIIYLNDTDIVYRPTPNSIRQYTFVRSDSMMILYTSTYSNWATSILGMCFGIIYVQNKRRNITDNKVISLACLTMLFALPTAAVLISAKQWKGISAAVLGPLVKPLFTCGIGIGILGMSHNIGGVIKWICENKFVVLMSNFSFSIYIFQMLIIFSKGAGSYSMMRYGVSEVVKSFLFFDAPVSILVGIVGALIFEQPGINLQKILLPQVPRAKQEKKN